MTSINTSTQTTVISQQKLGALFKGHWVKYQKSDGRLSPPACVMAVQESGVQLFQRRPSGEQKEEGKVSLTNKLFTRPVSKIRTLPGLYKNESVLAYHPGLQRHLLAKIVDKSRDDSQVLVDSGGLKWIIQRNPAQSEMETIIPYRGPKQLENFTSLIIRMDDGRLITTYRFR